MRGLPIPSEETVRRAARRSAPAVRVQVARVDALLADGRAFIAGSAVTVGDFAVYHALWFITARSDRLLHELKLEDDTIVFFTGDNGGQDRFRSGKHPRGFFGPNVNPKTGVEFRGGKGNLFEGGLRIPTSFAGPVKSSPGRSAT